MEICTLKTRKGISISLDCDVIFSTLARTVAWLEGYSLNIAHGSSVSEPNWTTDVSVLSLTVKGILFSGSRANMVSVYRELQNRVHTKWPWGSSA
jgi:hypothetical protein